MVGELRNETVVSDPRWVWPFVWISFPVLGAGLGWLLTLAAGWVADLPVAPFQGVFKAIDQMAEPYATAVALGVGLLAGLALAYLAARDALTVTVSGGAVTLTRGDGSTRSVPRTSVATAYLDGKQFVLLGRAGQELAREKSDLDAGQLREALRGHGYPWHDGGDPYRDEYRRWVPDTPDLPAGADALLKARAKALEKGDGDDAADLRSELGKLGVVVRDEKKRQYWRRVHPS